VRHPKTKVLSLLGLCMLAVAVAAPPQAAPVRQLTLVDREGRRTPVGTVPRATFAPRVSPDGSEVVFDTQDDGQLWIAKLSDVTAKRKLSTGGSNRGALWSGDGKRILYITDDQGEETLFWRAADGSGTPEPLTRPARAPESWSPREAGVSFITLNAGGDYDVWTFSLAAKLRAPFIAIPGTPQHSSHFSPDGRWIAYASAESGRLEVYVRPFPAGTPVVQVTHGGGEHPQWSPDQKQIYFDTTNHMYAAEIETEPSFAVGKTVALPITGFIQGPLRRQYDLMPDGKHFLMMFP